MWTIDDEPARHARASRGYLGIDLGTSGLKVVLVGEDGTLLADAEQGYDVRTPHPGHAEIDPGVWASALRSACERLATTAPEVSVMATGLAGQMHGLVLADTSGTPVRPAMLWPDQRAASVLPRWEALPERVRAGLANPVVAGMAGPMLTWLAHHQPEALASTAIVLSPKDWLRSRLTGVVTSERSDASATLLWDVTVDDWSKEAVALAGVEASQLPVIVASDEVTGHVEAGNLDAAGGLGVLRPGSPVAAGAADTAAALLPLQHTAVGGTGGTGDIVVNTGTGIQVVRPRVRPTPRVAPQNHLYADTDGGWYQMLAIQNGGLAVSWAHRLLGVSWDVAVAAARQVAPGSAGALFTPFLTGERGALALPGSTAGWTGLTASTGRPELVRAVFESYAFLVRRGVDLVDAGGGPVLLTGGGGRDPWLRQLLADALGRPIRYVALRSASATGAAMLAARSVGCRLPVPAEVVDVEPSTWARDSLESAYERWRRTAAP